MTPEVLVGQQGEVRLAAQPLLRFLASLGPLVGALAVTSYCFGWPGVRRLLGQALRRPPGGYWYLIALLGYVPIWAAALLLQHGIGESPPDVLLPSLEFLLVFWPGILLDGPLSEEFGWRGVLLPGLQHRLGAVQASLGVGVVWAIWHLPLFWIPGTLHHELPFGLFLIWLVAISIVCTWLYNSTGGSLVLPILFHTSVDTCALLTPLASAFAVQTALLWGAAGVLVVFLDPHTLASPRQSSLPRSTLRLAPFILPVTMVLATILLTHAGTYVPTAPIRSAVAACWLVSDFVTSNDWEYRVVNVQRQAAIPDPPRASLPPAHGSWLAVHVQTTNRAVEPRALTARDFDLQDGRGVDYRADSDATRAYVRAWNTEHPDHQLVEAGTRYRRNSGATIGLAFDVSTGASDFRFTPPLGTCVRLGDGRPWRAS